MRVRVLGGLSVEGVAERDLGSRKGRTLLKVLALARRAPVRVDQLADVLWGDEPPAKPADQVGVLVSRLRGVLGAERLPRTDGGYALLADWLDVDELAALGDAAAAALAEGRLGAARAAAEAGLALVRGPVLPDEDGAWVEAERVAADAAVGRLRVLAVEAASAAGDHGAAAALAERSLAHDPYDEVALRALMRAHLAAGRPASALAAYARVREQLAEDLGVPPTAETEALHAAALAAADGDRVATLPASSATTVVGREEEWAVLDAALAAAPGLVVVQGPAGIGKSTLVSSWAAGRRAILGRCDELGRDLPLQPLADALALHLRTLGAEVADEVLAGEAVVLGDVLGGGVPGPPAPPGPVEAAEGKARLFAALLAVLERAADVVVVEDLHAAGRSTLEWLAFAHRRAERLLIVVTSRDDVRELADAPRVALDRLDVGAVAELVGVERAEELHARSGGLPLLLAAMAAAPEAERPGSVVQAVDVAVRALGSTAEAAVRSAAVLGDEVDVDLVASLLQVPAVDLLGHFEAGVRGGLLVERGAGFASRHSLVRDALEAGVGPARRALLHRRAAALLAQRPAADALVVAVHARAGGDAVLAARSFASAADLALARFDVEAAASHANEAVALDPAAGSYLARARLRMALYWLEEAADDAERAVALGGGAPALETAGWVAYYRRRYDEAQRAADEAIAVADEPALRARCLALAGRIRHGAGDLRGAADLLQEAVQGPQASRAVSAVWLAAACAHLGRAHDALATLEGVQLDGSVHPFVPLHGRFDRVVALGHLGRAAEAMAAADDLLATARQAGAVGTRFLGVAANMRGWVLRWTGELEAADDAVVEGLEVSAGPGGLRPAAEPMSEPFWVARLDLADGRLLAGDDDGAATIEATLGGLETWQGTMAWHQRHRLQLLRARLALLDGDRARAVELAEGVRTDATSRGARRYELLAMALSGTAAGRGADLEALDAVVRELAMCAGLDGWRSVAELAEATGVDRWQAEAERRRAAVQRSRR